MEFKDLKIKISDDVMTQAFFNTLIESLKEIKEQLDKIESQPRYIPWPMNPSEPPPVKTPWEIIYGPHCNETTGKKP